MKLAILLVASLLGTQAFADEAVTPENAVSSVVITVAGKTVATILLAEQPQNSQLVVQASKTAFYDSKTGVTTLKAPFIIVARQEKKELWKMSISSGEATVTSKSRPQK